MPACLPGSVHPVWDVPSDPEQVTMATIKAKMLIQRYPVSASSHAGKSKSDICPLCRCSPETLCHFLLRCQALDKVRRFYIDKITSLLDRSNYILPANEDDCIQLILDASEYDLPDDDLWVLGSITRKMCFVLHNERAILLGGVSQYKLAREGWGPKKSNG